MVGEGKLMGSASADESGFDSLLAYLVVITDGTSAGFTRTSKMLATPMSIFARRHGAVDSVIAGGI